MTIYIVERNNPESWEEPEVYVNGKKALDTVREEYESQKEELGIEDENDGYGAGWCEWNISECDYCGDAVIDRDIDGDRWQWRITQHHFINMRR